jgi:hypothetical protein
VVLPASMWAMMPMLRYLLIGVLRATIPLPHRQPAGKAYQR